MARSHVKQSGESSGEIDGSKGVVCHCYSFKSEKEGQHAEVESRIGNVQWPKPPRLPFTKQILKLSQRALNLIKWALFVRLLEALGKDGKEKLQGEENFFYTLLLPRTKLVYQTILTVLVIAMAQFGFSTAWTFWIVIMVTGYDIWNMTKKLVSRCLGLPYKHDVSVAFSVNLESETVSWLNQLIRVAWQSCLRGFVDQDLRSSINALLQKWWAESVRKGWLTKTYTPSCFKLDIGDKAPWITAVKTYTSEVNQMNSSELSLTFDICLLMHLRTELRFGVSRVLQFALHEITFGAPLRIRLIPLLRDVTAFGQVQLALLRVPDVGYRASHLAGVLSFPFIQPFVISLARECFKFGLHPQKIVIPNSHVANFQDHALYTSRPIGMLRVNLVEGRDIKVVSKPGTWICLGRSDPYVILKLGPRTDKTAVIKRDLNPAWNHVGEFPITRQDYCYRELKAYVMDFNWGFWVADEDIGFSTMSVKSLVDQGHVEEWYGLGDGGDGSLHMIVTFVPVLDGLPPTIVPTDDGSSQGILTVLVFEVQMSHLCKPMVVLEVSGRKPVTSSCGHLSENWEFAEEFHFTVNNIYRDKISLSLVDFDAKITVKQVTKRLFRACGNFIAAAEKTQGVQEYNRERHYLLGEKTLDISEGFTGHRQIIDLQSDEGGAYKITVIGRLDFLQPY